MLIAPLLLLQAVPLTLWPPLKLLLLVKQMLLLLLALLFTGCTQATPAATTAKPETPALQVHYLDVGQADCALVRLGDTEVLIDGGNVDDGSYVVAYLYLAISFCKPFGKFPVG